MSVILEAGNHGFSSYRKLSKAGYHCKLIAPSSRPQRGKEQKTDRDDAINNLHYHLSGLLSYVWVPNIEDEATRECLRHRYRQIWNITKQKQRINSFTKRYGLEFTLTKSNWTVTHYKWLRSVSLVQTARFVLDEMLSDLNEQENRLQKWIRNWTFCFQITCITAIGMVFTVCCPVSVALVQ